MVIYLGTYKVMDVEPYLVINVEPYMVKDKESYMKTHVMWLYICKAI